MSDDPETPHEKMKKHDELDDIAHQYQKRKTAVHNEVKQTLTDTLEAAAAETGVAVELVEVNNTGEQFTFRPRFDAGAFVAEAEEQLPAGFHIDMFHDDGAISVVWTEQDDEPDDAVEVTTVLEGIIRERTVESEVMIEESPTRAEVLDTATSFGIDREVAEDTLTRMYELGKVDAGAEDDSANVWLT